MRGEDLMEAMGGLDEALLEKADSYQPEKKSRFAWVRYIGMAACLMLLIGLAARNIALAGGDKKSKQYKDGNVYKVEPFVFYRTEDVEITPLYIMTVSGGKLFDAAVEEITKYNAGVENLQKQWTATHPDNEQWGQSGLYTWDVDLSYAIPVLAFPESDEYAVVFYFFKVEDGNITECVQVGMSLETGECVYAGGADYSKVGVPLDVQYENRVGDGAFFRWMAHLTSEDNPLKMVCLVTEPSNQKQVFSNTYYVIGDTAYCPVDFGNQSAYADSTPEIDWQRVKEYGWELEVRKIELY